MATTMAQALAERLRYQISSGEKVLQACGDQTGAVFGNPADVLSVRGNVSDVAWTNHLWLLDAVAAGAVNCELVGDLRKTRPASIPEAVAFLAPRDTDSAEQAQAHLTLVNNALADAVAGLSDADLERPVEVTFYGAKSLRDLLFIVIEHGALHIGQAWGILKGKGLA
jgi:uncharacterized damage-inducible protein DinB